MVEAPNTHLGLKKVFLDLYPICAFFNAKTLHRFGYLVSSLHCYVLGSGFQSTDLSGFLT